MSLGPLTASPVQDTASTPVRAPQPLPARIDGRDNGDGWQIATDPHAQSSDGTLTESTVLVAGNGVFVTRERGGGYDGIVITTTNADDSVKVDQQPDGTVDITVNGETTNVRLAKDQQLEIRSEGGNDKVEIDHQVTAGVTVYGGEGDDTLTMTGSGSIDMAGTPGESRGNQVQLIGESGNDTIQAFAANDGAGRSARVLAEGGDGDDQISVIGDAGRVYGGDGNDTLAVFGQNASVNAGEGDDTVNTRGNGVGVDTGGGRDQVNVVDGTATVAGDFSFWSYLTGEHDTASADPGASVTEVPRQ